MKVIAYILIGNVGSGKSTWAKKFVKKNPDTVIVCRDDIRQMLNGRYVFSEQQEPLVMSIRNRCIEEVLREGYNVIIDETSLNQMRRAQLIAFLKYASIGIIIKFVWFKTSREKCIMNRTKDNKGYTEEKWEDIYERLGSAFDEPNEKQEMFDELIVVE